MIAAINGGFYLLDILQNTDAHGFWTVDYYHLFGT